MLVESSALSDLRAEFSRLVSECSGVMAKLVTDIKMTIAYE